MAILSTPVRHIPQVTRRLKLLWAGLAMGLIAGLSPIVWGHVAHGSTPPLQLSSSHQPAIPSTPSAPAPQPAGTTISVTVSSCTPVAATTPSQLDLSAQPAGLITLIDTPQTYEIYGTNATGLADQMQRCAPSSGQTGAEFTAQTSYRLTWQYNTTLSAQGCSLSNVKVGLHTVTILPYWQPTASADAGLASRWNSYEGALATHEAGHVTIDTTYAQALLHDLQGVLNIDCTQLSAHVTNLLATDTNALNQANDTYDQQTKHGATQGAIFSTR